MPAKAPSLSCFSWTEEGSLPLTPARYGARIVCFVSLQADALPDTLPDQLAWCGSDAVLLFWEVRQPVSGPLPSFKYIFECKVLLLLRYQHLPLFLFRSLCSKAR